MEAQSTRRAVGRALCLCTQVLEYQEVAEISPLIWHRAGPRPRTCKKTGDILPVGFRSCNISAACIWKFTAIRGPCGPERALEAQDSSGSIPVPKSVSRRAAVSNVVVSSHPLVQHKLAVLRDVPNPAG